jgi:hypothetical protein
MSPTLRTLTCALLASRAASSLSAAAPVLPPLRGIDAGRRLRGARGALDRLEQKIGARLQTVAEAKELSARTELVARHNAVVDDARGWFEEDAAFELRLAHALAAGGPPKKGAKK